MVHDDTVLADVLSVDKLMMVLPLVCWHDTVLLAILLRDFSEVTDLVNAFAPDTVPGGTAAEAVLAGSVPENFVLEGNFSVVG